MPTFYRITFYPGHGLEGSRETLPEIDYDECIKITKHDIDIARINLFQVKQDYEDQLQRGAEALAHAKEALKAKEQELKTMKYFSLFKYGNPKSAKGGLKSKEDVIEREEEEAKLEGLKHDVEVSQQNYDRIQENQAWDMWEARCFEVVAVRQLGELVNERDEQIKGDEKAVDKVEVVKIDGDQSTCVGM